MRRGQKNIIALAAGMAEGMGCGDNAKALMMSRALVELSALIKAAGGQENTCFGLAGMGDMIVTCTSPHSRNHMAGVAIGRGEHVAGPWANATRWWRATTPPKA